MPVLSISPYRRRMRLWIVLLVMLAFLAIDGAMLLARPNGALWDLGADAAGRVTWVDPSGPAGTADVTVGDLLLGPAGTHVPAAQLVQQRVLRVRDDGRTRVIPAAPAFGPSLMGQALVLVGALWLLIGGVAWAYSRRQRVPALLCAMTGVGALSLLGASWGFDGYEWALHVTFVGSHVLFPVAWAAFFLSFPHNRLSGRRWVLPLGAIVALAALSLLAYAGFVWIGLPFPLADAPAAPILPCGVVLGLVALVVGGKHEHHQARQQRLLVGLSAGGALLPFLVLSLAPDMAFGRPLLPYAVSALAFVLLPLGMAYAIVRYDLMGLDVVVRRLVAALLGSAVLIAATLVIGTLLQPLVPSHSLPLLPVAVLAGALGWRVVGRWTQNVVEHLLSPELVRTRRLLEDLDAVVQRGPTGVAEIVAGLEGAAGLATGAPWVRLLLRERVAGSVFRQLREDTAHVVVPGLAAGLLKRPWGLTRSEATSSIDMDEWAALVTVLERDLALVVPLRLRDEVIGVLAVGERPADDPLSGPDREALALLAAYCTLPIDHGRVRAELEAEGDDAATYSAACADLTAALDDREALPLKIVDSLSRLRDVRGAALLLSDTDGARSVAAQGGDMAPWLPLVPPHTTTFTLLPHPHAWVPLIVGNREIGALCIGWHDRHIIHEYDRRLLAVFADSAALALEQARLYEQARHQAERDPVTNLYNHRAFHKRLEAALAHGRETDTPVSLLLIDLVDFKLFNDTLGHQAGDHALQWVSEVLGTCCRGSAWAARLGGDEFAMALPGHTLDMARVMAERINDVTTLSALTLAGNHTVPVRLSIGVAVFPSDADAASALLARADERMYEAKRSGIAIATVGRTALDRDDADEYGTYDLLEALVAMVDNRDSYTAEHSEQVATYACAIGAEIGLSSVTIDKLRLAGLVHDVGKIGVPNRILRKPTKLTDEEFTVIRRHVELSETLVAAISHDQELLDAVRYHHERWDGQGYPRGLSGCEVSLLGRIMIVADAVSAMGMDRPYRKGLSWQKIARELRRHAGAQFDPDLVLPALHALAPHVERTQAA